MLCTLLTACATSQPSHVALNPTLGVINQQPSMLTPLRIETIDIRKANFIVRIHQSNGAAAKLISPSEPVRQQLDEVFRQGLIVAGYSTSANASQSVQFQLDTLLTDVTETTFGYEAKTQVTFNVIAKSNTLEFTKIFNGRSTLTGPFSSDFATLELDINSLLDKLTTEILNDAELHQFIQNNH